MKHKIDKDFGHSNAKRYHGYSYVQLSGGPQLLCRNQADAQLLCDLINRLAIEFNDAKEEEEEL